ncbi:MAG: hypothetical protein ACYCX7_07315, partial [Solirubrobacteraceae bacterium]
RRGEPFAGAQRSTRRGGERRPEGGAQGYEDGVQGYEDGEAVQGAAPTAPGEEQDYAEHEGYADEAGYEHEDPLLLAPAGGAGRRAPRRAAPQSEAGDVEDEASGSGEAGGERGLSALSEIALSHFNASDASSRIAGIARALGEPEVCVRPLDEDGRRVSIVVAWELCWYRYEVDMVATTPLVALAGDGTELHELPAEDRAVNARADERGELSLI